MAFLLKVMEHFHTFHTFFGGDASINLKIVVFLLAMFAFFRRLKSSLFYMFAQLHKLTYKHAYFLPIHILTWFLIKH